MRRWMTCIPYKTCERDRVALRDHLREPGPGPKARDPLPPPLQKEGGAATETAPATSDSTRNQSLMHREDTQPPYPQQPARVAKLIFPESSSTEPKNIEFGAIPTCVGTSNPASETDTRASQGAEEDREFPLQCLPDTVRTMAEAVAKSANVAIELVVLSVLAVLSSVIGKYLRVTSGPDRTTSANLYILGFALSGTGKSEAVRHVFKPVHDIQQSLITNWRSTTRSELDAKLRRLGVEIKKIERDLERERDSDAADGLEIDLAEKLRKRQKLEDEIQSPPKI